MWETTLQLCKIEAIVCFAKIVWQDIPALQLSGQGPAPGDSTHIVRMTSSLVVSTFVAKMFLVD